MITKSNTIGEILQLCPNAAEILMKFGYSILLKYFLIFLNLKY